MSLCCFSCRVSCSKIGKNYTGCRFMAATLDFLRNCTLGWPKAIISS